MRPGATLIALAFAFVALPATGFAADPVKGEAIYEDRCSLCHVEEGPGQGPDLKGVVGRKAGTLAGFNYTAAMKASSLTWTPADLDRFLQGPMKLVPGTTMPMTVPDSSERQDLIAFLASRK